MYKVETYWYRDQMSYTNSYSNFHEALEDFCNELGGSREYFDNRVTWFYNDGDPIVTKTWL